MEKVNIEKQLIWKGCRDTNAETNPVLMSADGGALWANLPLYLSEVNHSPDGFEWGYNGSGPTQLAYAILRSYFEIVEELNIESARFQAQKFCFEFRQQFVSRWKKNEWKIDSEYIAIWIGGQKAGWFGDYNITSGSAVIRE